MEEDHDDGYGMTRAEIEHYIGWNAKVILKDRERFIVHTDLGWAFGRVNGSSPDKIDLLQKDGRGMVYRRKTWESNCFHKRSGEFTAYLRYHLVEHPTLGWLPESQAFAAKAIEILT
jgi:hypothetical protein